MCCLRQRYNVLGSYNIQQGQYHMQKIESYERFVMITVILCSLFADAFSDLP